MKFMNRLLSRLFIFIIVIIVIFLRFYQLGQIPKGINVDEASYGYDAYSLLKTKHDMWGDNRASLKSFGDYKPAGLSYTMVPAIKYFGLGTFATRLPSATFGLLTLLISFFILKNILQSALIALIGTLVLSLSPWHFGLSRLFYEPNVGLFFIVCSIFLQLKTITNPVKIKYLIMSSILVAIGGYYYSVLRYLGVGLLVISTIIAYYPSHLKILKYGIVAIFVWALVALPYLGDMFGNRGLIRLQQEGSLHEFGDTLVITENRQMCYISSGYSAKVAKLCYLLWNKPGEKLVNTAKVYLQLLSPKYLFLNGYQKDVVPESYGAFLEFLSPFYLLGLYYLVVNLSRKREHLFILIGWLFTAIPVALAGALNIHRNVVGLYFVFLICLYGILYFRNLLSQISSRIIGLTIILVVSLAYIWSQSRYLGNYYFVYTRMQPEIWQYDTGDIMHWLAANKRDRTINYYDYDFAPLYYSFYNQLDPLYFQTNTKWSKVNQYGWTHTDSIGSLMRNHSNIWEVICLQADNNTPPSILVVTGGKSEWQSVVEQQFKNFTGIHVTHEIYDSQVLYNYLQKTDPASLKATCSNLK